MAIDDVHYGYRAVVHPDDRNPDWGDDSRKWAAQTADSPAEALLKAGGVLNRRDRLAIERTRWRQVAGGFRPEQVQIIAVEPEPGRWPTSAAQDGPAWRRARV